MTYKEFLVRAADTYRRYGMPSQGNMRVGQCYWDALPENMIVLFHGESDGFRRYNDPYYSDGNLPAFLIWVYDNWSTQ